MRAHTTVTYRLFIDDEREPPRGQTDWVVARTSGDARAFVQTLGLPGFISFDHDLGDNEPTGYDFVRWFGDFIMDNNLPYADFDWYVHSQNPIGAQNINGYLGNFLPVWKSGGWSDEVRKDQDGR